jgi:hypothetical protein
VPKQLGAFICSVWTYTGISSSSEIVFLTSLGKVHVSRIVELLVHVVDLLLINGDLGGLKNWCLDKSEVGVTRNTAISLNERLPDESAEEPNEGLFELIVRLSRDVIVLQVLLSVESDLLGLDLAVLHVDLVSDEHNGNVLADAHKILVPFGHILIGDARAHIEHNNGAVATDAKERLS